MTPTTISPYKQGYQAGQAGQAEKCPKNLKGQDKVQWQKGYKLGLVVAKKKANS